MFVGPRAAQPRESERRLSHPNFPQQLSYGTTSTWLRIVPLSQYDFRHSLPRVRFEHCLTVLSKASAQDPALPVATIALREVEDGY